MQVHWTVLISGYLNLFNGEASERLQGWPLCEKREGALFGTINY
jgi:hypothetical protein